MDIKGHLVERVWIEAGSKIAKEYYLSVTFDRGTKKPLVMLSAEGGVDIEEVAANRPEALARLHIDPLVGLQPHDARWLCFHAGIDTEAISGTVAIIQKLYAAFVGLDAMLTEINPLILTEDGKVIALDAKVTTDGNAAYRHDEMAEFRETTTDDPQEKAAQEKGVTYVKLDGDVGILGNGAGLVMSTLDVVALAGGTPAQLPGRGRRLEGRRGGHRPRGAPLRPEGEGAAGQHLRRHHPLRRGGRGPPDRAGQPRRHPADRGAPGRHQRGGGPADPEGAGAVQRRRRDHHALGRGAGRQPRGGGRMSILVNADTKLVVQGITGREGAFHAGRNKAYGTQVVAGVTPGKGGQDVDGIPVFNTLKDAVEETGANAAMVFVPPRFAADALYEAVDSDVGLIVCITEGIPAHDVLRVYTELKRGDQVLVGPNCPGIISPGVATVGIMPTQVFTPGRVGLVSRSGTLTYQISKELSDMGIGQSTVVGIGGDPVVGSSFIDILGHFEADPDTDLVVMVGEIGGAEEEKAADFITSQMSTPVVAYIAGFQAPPGKQMGHAGAIITGSSGTAAAKKEALEANGVRVGTSPTETAQIAREALGA